MTEKPIDLEKVTADFREFARQFGSVQLATASDEGQPEASYAPFVRQGRDFYVYVSELSRHTRNLAENPRASLLLIENESDARHLFARRRLSYQCDAEEVPRVSERFDATLDQMHQQFGDIIGVLRNLNDFHLYRLRPYTGTFVAGFALAFELTGDDLDQLQHIDDSNSRASD